MPAFVDGTFAIIITILVLEIGVPSDLSEQSLREAIDETGPTLIAWVISFLLVGMYWVWHRDLFVKVRYVNRDAIWLNIIFLLPVCLVPFAAAVLGDYHDEPIALHLYGSVLIVVSLMRIALYWYLSRRPQLLWEPISVRERRLGIVLACVPMVLYAVAMIVADAAHQLSLFIYLSVPALYFVLVTILRDRPATATDADNFS
ncbi:MAG: TMEM175 family protein [Actinomycetota bacterium]|nr:TMEM175 family protein [Actinomycetota bacterium]